MNARLRTKIPLFFPFLFLVISCGSDSKQIDLPEDIAAMENVSIYDGDAEPLQDITFERTARFGETENVLIGGISGTEVGDDGTFYLADGSEGKIHLYEPTGQYKRSIGGKGEGPGEFLTVSQPTIMNGKLYVLDIQQQRVSVFNEEDGRFLQAHDLGTGSQDMSGFPVNFSPLSGDRFLTYYNRMEREENKFYRQYVPRIQDSDGNTLVSEFITFQPGEMLMIQSDNSISIMPLPFLGESQFSLTRDEEIITGFTDRFLFHVISLEGDTLRSIYHSKKSPPLDQAEILENYEEGAVREQLRSMDLPETKPAFQTFIVDDDNRLWVMSPTEDAELNEWWVLDENGEKLAEFNRPASDRIRTVKNGHAYIVETDEETGLQEVVKYRFSLNDR